MKRVLVVLALLFGVTSAHAHVGSYDVFFDGDAGPGASWAANDPPVKPEDDVGVGWMTPGWRPRPDLACVGWVERSETHRAGRA